MFRVFPAPNMNTQLSLKRGWKEWGDKAHTDSEKGYQLKLCQGQVMSVQLQYKLKLVRNGLGIYIKIHDTEDDVGDAKQYPRTVPMLAL
jgi:hypothetical protein